MSKVAVVSLFPCCLRGCYVRRWPQIFVLAQMIDSTPSTCDLCSVQSICAAVPVRQLHAVID